MIFFIYYLYCRCYCFIIKDISNTLIDLFQVDQKIFAERKKWDQPESQTRVSKSPSEVLFLRDKYYRRVSTVQSSNSSTMISSVTSAKSLPLPAAISLKNSFTQRIFWHASALSLSILALQFIYLQILITR